MLKIFNTFTKKKEIFKTVVPGLVNMYVCGVTVDNLCHIGHARTFVVFDMIARYLKFYGYKLNYVRNITDIDDKIIKKVIFLKKDYSLFVNQMIKDMNLDFFNLNLLKPDKEPRATKHINVMIKFIENLLEQKYAYISNKGDIIFSVRAFSEYGQLSNQDITQLQSGNRVIVDVDKKNSKDFVLWKKSTTEFKSKDIENQFSWSSPWGEGRPGWHVECSAISALYFKDGIDIHGGGIDLVFPHHENENAQLCCFNKKKFVNYWMHSGLLLTNNKKMSKSLNNFFVLKKIFKHYHSEIIRFFLLSTHYRHPIHFNANSLKNAALSLSKLYSVLRSTRLDLSAQESSINYFKLEFMKSMNNDFNTPKAISILFLLAKEIKLLKNKNLQKINELTTTLRILGSSLGILLEDPFVFLNTQKYCLFKDKLTSTQLELLIKYRNIARSLKNWSKADFIRKKLSLLGIYLVDK